MAGSDRDEDDDSVLDLAEQLNRPTNTALNQQRIQAWQPILDPVWVIVALFYMGIIMVPVGFKIDSVQNEVVELRETYDGVPNPSCGIGKVFNANKTCIVNFTAPEYMEPPILIHYELTNFYQNHRSYSTSRDSYQLYGQVGGQNQAERDACKPLNTLGNMTLNPCGLTANTFFNDIFKLVSGNDADGKPLQMNETGIAWKTDIEYVFNQPDGFKYEECPCTEACCISNQWSCKKFYKDEKTGKCYRYHYPNDDTTQYLYETYPEIISPLEGVTNEHFIVWMRIAAQPTFRKLYGWIDQPIAEGEVIQFSINANYVVERFGGTKSLLIGTTSIFGGRNNYLFPLFSGVGIFCLIAGVFFALKHFFRPRKLADPSYLYYQE